MKCSQCRDGFPSSLSAKREGLASLESAPARRFWSALAHISTYSFNTPSLPFGANPSAPFSKLYAHTHTQQDTNTSDWIHDLGDIATRFWDLGYTKWDTDGKRS